jgi:murein DD-endopeptidase MepM/ murein hydrolase activator NlpD
MNLRVIVLLLALIAFPAPSQAQDGFGKGGKKLEQARMDGGANVIKASGLRPAYPGNARCPEIASPYASPTRYDGSARQPWAFGGLHGGIDISLEEGTPLLALAAGTVEMKGEGGMLEGIYLWLRHAPEDTGLPYWVYSKYQHLQSLPELEAGARVREGQVIARSGKTGTEGKHYGASGYPHLHLTTRRSPEDVAAAGSRGFFGGAALFDPLAIYHEAGARLRGTAASSLPDGVVPIPYATADGKIATPGTRVVWPVACQPK